MARHTCVHMPCIQCRCKFRGPTSWLDNRPNSQWQNTLLQADTWHQHWNSPCLLLKLPGVSCWTISYDLIHNFWLGWLQFAYGSIFYLLCFEILEEDPLTNLKTVGAFIREFQRKDKGHQRYRQRLEKLSMFVKQSGYPKLKGRASDIQGLCAALKACWMANMRAGVLQDQQIAAFLELNLDIHGLLEDYSPKYGFMSLPAPQCDELYTKGLAMAQLHVCLLEHYEQQEVQIRNLTSKTHYCLHSFYLARWLHPSLTWAFKGESTMKAVQTLWKSCLAGNKHWAVCKIAAFKMRHLMHLKDEKAWPKNACITFEHYLKITCDTCIHLNHAINSNTWHQTISSFQLIPTDKSYMIFWKPNNIFQKMVMCLRENIIQIY